MHDSGGKLVRDMLTLLGLLGVTAGFFAGWATNSLAAFVPVPLGFALLALVVMLRPMLVEPRPGQTVEQRRAVIALTKLCTAAGILVLGTGAVFVLTVVAAYLSGGPE
ncbi:hypothetical protein [Nocardia sp. NPDC004722]